MKRNKPVGFLCSDSHYDAALKIAQEGIVLLKNDVVRERRSKEMMTVGGGSSSLKAQHEILPLDGLTSSLSHLTSSIEYARGYVGDTIQSYNGVTVGRSLYETRSQAELTAEAVEKARGADVVIFVGGLNKSDHQDCEGHDRKSLGSRKFQRLFRHGLLVQRQARRLPPS